MVPRNKQRIRWVLALGLTLTLVLGLTSVALAADFRSGALPELLAAADIVTLHCPLMPATHHLINAEQIARMKVGVMLINTSRGALLDTLAVTQALKAGQIGYLGLDVYEEEAELFFEDRSNAVMQDDVFARLLTFPNVLITSHQAFFTRNAMNAIAETTLANIAAFARDGMAPNQVSIPTNRRE